MTKISNINIDEDLKTKVESFIKKTESKMHFKSNTASDLTAFDWIDEIDFACPYIDNIIRKPRLSLISEEDVVEIDKARKITVASVKDLSIHTQFIEKVDKETNDVKPSQILIERNEETYNIYENRFAYTLIDNLTRFMMKREALLENLETQDDKVLEYAASTVTDSERINIELKIGSKELPKETDDNNLKEKIANIKERIKRIKGYISSWQKSEFIKALEKAHASFVVAPIRKTNVILKNPNFQFAMKLWNFLRSYDDAGDDNPDDGIDSSGDDVLRGILDDSFLIDYFVLDSISSKKKEQKDKISKYAILMIKQQVQRTVALLLNSGIEISEEELLNMLAVEIDYQRNKIATGSTDVKKKFKSAMDEYLEKAKEYM